MMSNLNLVKQNPIAQLYKKLNIQINNNISKEQVVDMIKLLGYIFNTGGNMLKDMVSIIQLNSVFKYNNRQQRQENQRTKQKQKSNIEFNQNTIRNNNPFINIKSNYQKPTKTNLLQTIEKKDNTKHHTQAFLQFDQSNDKDQINCAKNHIERNNCKQFQNQNNFMLFNKISQDKQQNGSQINQTNIQSGFNSYDQTSNKLMDKIQNNPSNNHQQISKNQLQDERQAPKRRQMLVMQNYKKHLQQQKTAKNLNKFQKQVPMDIEYPPNFNQNNNDKNKTKFQQIKNLSLSSSHDLFDLQEESVNSKHRPNIKLEKGKSKYIQFAMNRSKEQKNQFDDQYQDKSVRINPGRKKKERQAYQGIQCPSCYKFYQALGMQGDKICQCSSRHKSNLPFKKPKQTKQPNKFDQLFGF